MDDLGLFRRWCEGDRESGNRLFQRHFRAVFRFFEHAVNRPEDAEELVQETFLACVRNREKFRQESKFRSFLFGIARHRLYAYWRGRARRGHEIDFSEASIEDLTTTPGTRVGRTRDHQRLLAALRTLPLEQQLLLMLFYWEEMDQNQLAEVFDIAPATTRSRLFRARDALRNRLAAMDGNPDISEISFEDLQQWACSLQ